MAEAAEAAEAVGFTLAPAGAVTATLRSLRGLVQRTRKRRGPSRPESPRPGVGACPDGARGPGEELRSGRGSQIAFLLHLCYHFLDLAP